MDGSIFDAQSAGDDLGDDFADLCGLGDDDFAGVEESDEELEAPTPEGVKRVEVSTLTPETFEEEFAKPQVPVILTGARDILPMSFLDLLLEAYGGKYVPLDFDQKTLVKLNDFCRFDDQQLQRSYVRNLHVSSWFPEVLKHVTFPSVFGHNYLSDTTKNYPTEYNNWYELFINCRKCIGFPFLHRDTNHTHAFTMQLQGVKQFWLFPFEDRNCLYPSTVGIGGHRSNIPTRDIVNNRVDLNMYPLYANSHPQRADLEPGELLFLPCDWWHTTTTISEIGDPSVSLGGNFVTESNREAFVSAWRDYTAHLSLIKHGAVTFN